MWYYAILSSLLRNYVSPNSVTLYITQWEGEILMMSYGGVLFPALLFQDLHHSPEVWPYSFCGHPLVIMGLNGGRGDVKGKSPVGA